MENRFDRRVSIESGICLIIFGGRLDSVCMYCSTYIRNRITHLMYVLQYIHTESNQPPNIIKHMLASRETRLSKLSSNETIFKESTTHYKNNLPQYGYNKKLTYKSTDTNHQKHSKHKRKIIWFNPPFSKNVSTKIGKSFLSLLDLHFPRNLIYSSIFNRNKIKVSYSCMQNLL